MKKVILVAVLLTHSLSGQSQSSCQDLENSDDRTLIACQAEKIEKLENALLLINEKFDRLTSHVLSDSYSNDLNLKGKLKIAEKDVVSKHEISLHPTHGSSQRAGGWRADNGYWMYSLNDMPIQAEGKFLAKGGFYVGNSHSPNEIIDSSGNIKAQIIRSDGGFQVDGKIVIDGDLDTTWFRSYGNAGWYNETYKGGWFMQDSIWVRTWNSKSVYTPSVVRADNGFQVDGTTVIDGSGVSKMKHVGTDDCYDSSWWTSFDKKGWSTCDYQQGYVLVGLYRNDCDSLGCIELAKCCRLK